MKQCWPEGTLRAYLDGELPPEQMRSVASHLEQCPACGRLHMELSVRASYIGGLLGTLAAPVARTAPRKVVHRVSGSWAWTGAAVALAAGLAVAAMLIPTREPVRQAVLTPPPQTAITRPALVEVPVVASPSQAVAVSTTAKRRRVKQTDPFIALDDEPIESGIVMRVELPGSTPADIIFSPDGRARAVRLVSGTQRNY